MSEKKTNPLDGYTNSNKTEQIPVKHVFTKEETQKHYDELRIALNNAEQAEMEFDAIKQQWKTKLAQAASKVNEIRGYLNAGFEFRPTDCAVYYDVKNKKKHYVHESEIAPHIYDSAIVYTTDMAASDFQVELQLAEARFDPRQEIHLFPRTEKDHGILVLGKFMGKWYPALHVQIGALYQKTRLDSEKKCFKVRFDAIQYGAKAMLALLTEKLGKDVAKGFEEPIAKAVEAEKDKVE